VTPTTQTFIEKRLHAIRRRHLLRQLTPLAHGTAPWIEMGQRRLLNLSSNNYLGLADHPRLKEAAIAAIQKYGCGAGASRLVTGNTPLHEELEQRLATFKGSEEALLFTSGYQANMGVIAALVGPHDVVLGDALNHASIIDGCRLSGAEYKTYSHCNTASLAQQLETLERHGHRGTRLVVTDSVFSMDGDLAPLHEIATICNTYQALLLVDEAHATGCLGPNGRGLVAQLGLEASVTASISTLSKAFGAIGAFVISSNLIKTFLTNVARPFIFTTALPPADIAASLAALDILETNPDLPARLQRTASFFRTGLRSLGFQTLASETQIIPLLIGDSAQALHIADLLREHGIYAVAIRPPSVPMGAARIRFSVLASHTEEDMAFALDVIKKVMSQRLDKSFDGKIQ
jgi:8-amino-7-oxononanoate synthase